MKQAPIKEAPPYDLYIQMDEATQSQMRKKFPGLDKFYVGFEDLHPITRELLERARKKKTLKLTLGYINHCFKCDKHLGPKFDKRPGGGVRLFMQYIRTFTGYRNKRTGDPEGSGFFCEDCAPVCIEELQREFDKRSLNLKIVNKCNVAKYRKIKPKKEKKSNTSRTTPKP